MNSLSIKQLQEKVALERNEDAYKLLFLHFYKGLIRFAFSIVKTREASEEVVSDVMLKLWTMKEALSRVMNLNVYLYKATKNTALNYLHSKASHRFCKIEITEEVFEFDLDTPEQVMLKTEWKREMMRAINELPPKCRMVYKLIREEGLSYKSVAAIMEISENTVDRHLNNALHKLVNAMKIYMQLKC